MISQWLTGPKRDLSRFGEIAAFKEGLYQLGDNASYAYMVPNGSWGENNIGLIDCKGKSILIDTCWDVNLTRQVLDHAGNVLASSPVEMVINTHSDGDHCWGNQLFSDKKIIATKACINHFHHTGPKALSALKKGGKWLKAVPMWGLNRFGHYMHHMFEPYDFSDLILTPPNQGFSGEHTITLNGVEIVIKEVGPGHTQGDAIVHVPDQKIVYAADILFVGVTPVIWSGPLENVIKALADLLALKPDFIIPGHGPMATRKDVLNLMAYWEFVDQELYRRFQQSMPCFEAAKDILFSREFQTKPFATWDSPERIVTSAHTLYRSWGAKMGGFSEKIETLNIFRKQAQVAFSLPHASPKRLRGAKGEGIELYSAD